MKVAEEVNFEFDYTKSADPVFKDSIACILWSVIKVQHITSQYFNGNILSVAKELREKKPKCYTEFRIIIKLGPLSEFGKDNGDMDDEFWKGVYKYFTGETILKINGHSVADRKLKKQREKVKNFSLFNGEKNGKKEN